LSLWRFIHLLALCYMMAGVGGTVVPIWRAWMADALDRRALLLEEAHRNESTVLLPGMIAMLVSGYAWAAAADINVVTTGWVVLLQIVTWADLFVFLPLMGVGLRRVRYLALAAAREGAMTEDLKSALADNVPLVFSTLIALTVPVMIWLPVFKPF
jgi:hypothetical protein